MFLLNARRSSFALPRTSLNTPEPIPLQPPNTARNSADIIPRNSLIMSPRNSISVPLSIHTITSNSTSRPSLMHSRGSSKFEIVNKTLYPYDVDATLDGANHQLDKEIRELRLISGTRAIDITSPIPKPSSLPRIDTDLSSSPPIPTVKQQLQLQLQAGCSDQT